MSELEKQQRDEHRRHRKMWCCILAGILALFVIASAVFTLIYRNMNRKTFVTYEESGRVLYKAYLQNNNFYEESYLNGNHAYVSSLIDRMTADFTYELFMDAEDVSYRYSYRVEAQLDIRDKGSKAPIYNPVYVLLEERVQTTNEPGFVIREPVPVDYRAYNNRAQAFVSTYGLNNVQCSLEVRLHVQVAGVSESFASDSSTRTYVVTMAVPLCQPVVKPEASSSVPVGEQKILAKDENSPRVFGVLALVFGGLAAASLIALIAFMILTKDKHVDYARKVRRILVSYKSYIQTITSPFNAKGYQVLNVNHFRELLDLRDTLQMPILMYENEDRTLAQFQIATGTGLLYLYEIQVDGRTDADASIAL